MLTRCREFNNLVEAIEQQKMTCPGQVSRELCKIPYGNLKVPYADPAWYRGVPSPYYNDTHVVVRDKVIFF